MRRIEVAAIASSLRGARARPPACRRLRPRRRAQARVRTRRAGRRASRHRPRPLRRRHARAAIARRAACAGDGARSPRALPAQPRRRLRDPRPGEASCARRGHREAPGRALGGPLPAAARRRAGAGRRARRQPRRPGATCCPPSGETLPAGRVDTLAAASGRARPATPRSRAVARSGASVSGVTARRPRMPELVDLRRRAARRARPRRAGAGLAARGRPAAAAVPINELVLVDAAARHGGPARSTRSQDAKNRSVCDADNSDRPGARAPRRCAPRAALPGAATRTSTLPSTTPATPTTSSRGLGRDSLDDSGLPLKSTVRYCDPGAAVPVPERVLGRRADGLRRGLRGGRRRRRPRADARRHRLQLAASSTTSSRARSTSRSPTSSASSST